MAELFPKLTYAAATNRSVKRLFEDKLNRGHFYDLSEISEETWNEQEGQQLDGTTSFLPSEVTIAEAIRVSTLQPRVLYILERLPKGIGVHTITEEADGGIGLGPVFLLTPEGNGAYKWEAPSEWEPNIDINDGSIDMIAGEVFSVLHMINRPHTHVIHREWDSVNRKKVKGYRGAYFSGYSEVVIKDRFISDERHGDTGARKCLHYVRAHRRTYRASGKSVIIPEHWRGDSKLGVKDHRYKVKS